MGVESISHGRVLKPQREWGWEIDVYLYFAGMGAGSFLIGVILGWLGHSLEPFRPFSLWGSPLDLSKGVFLWGPVLVAIGAPFLILDLGIKKRFLYACLNPKTSWVARGFLILSSFITLGLLTLATSLFSFPWFDEREWLRFTLEGVGVVLACATVIYTGILLRSVRYISLWNTVFLPFLFFASALSAGGTGILLATVGYDALLSQGLFSSRLLDPLIPLIIMFMLIEGAALGLLILSKYREPGEGNRSVRLLMLGDKRYLFWGGTLAAGFVIPFLLLLFHPLFPGNAFLLILTGVLLLSGRFFLRYGILTSGVKDRSPFYKLVETKLALGASRPVPDNPMQRKFLKSVPPSGKYENR